MLLLLCAHFHRRNHTTATGSACSGDNATTSCAAASHTASQPQPQRTPCATALTRVYSLHRRLVVRVQRQRPASHAVHAPAVLHWHKVSVVPRHERPGVRRVRAEELGEAPAGWLAGVIGGIVFARRDDVRRRHAYREHDDGVLAAGRRCLQLVRTNKFPMVSWLERSGGAGSTCIMA